MSSIAFVVALPLILLISISMSNAAYLVFDCESIPDGNLLSRVKFAGQNLSPEEAIVRAQAEAREKSANGSDFLPLTFQYPVAVCVAKVAKDFRLLSIRCLDSPQFRTREITKAFWDGVAHYKATLVSFNGRGFDFPLMELAAFRYGLSIPVCYQKQPDYRYRFGAAHFDMMEFFTCYGAYRMTGGLNLLSKLLGKPGKQETDGSQVYDMYRQGRLADINAYCSFDVLDTYFVFLRTRVMTGEITLEQEHAIVLETKTWLEQQTVEQPHLRKYLENWGDWVAWP
jgi:predicted PolB exonuclease-like 3'-5' exonuclease